MRSKKLTLIIFLLGLPSVCSAEKSVPMFKDHNVAVSTGPFVDILNINNTHHVYSKKWVKLMQEQLGERVNFAGHYRLYISKGGELIDDCGINGWVCGWIIDKKTGGVVSVLPNFNGNSKYYSTIDNGTSSPYLFSLEFYKNSNLIWVNGENIPESKVGNISLGDKKCSNNAYLFKDNSFSLAFVGECEVDHGGN